MKNPASNRYVPLLLLLLFVGSGCSALIYEVVWLQMLQLVIGSSSISLGVLLGTFMGGMCLGSLALPRLISPKWHPLGVYAVLELGIGALGLLILLGIPYVNHLYLTWVGHGMPNVLLRGLVCVLCLLPPTMLMGATLPAVARWIKTTRQDVSLLGFFYGANIAGAVWGCVLAGFYLLRVHNMAVATYVAVAINLLVGVIALTMTRWTVHSAQPAADPRVPVPSAPAAWVAYVVIALSGLCALGAEVVWTRQMSLLLGATVYTFSIILSVFLVGLGIGSSVGALLSRRVQDPRWALGACQAMVVAAVAWTAYQLNSSLPYWPIDVRLPSSAWLGFQLDVLRCLWAFLPASLLWGASFPLALAAAAVQGRDAGRLVGGVYAANTAGAIVGALGFSMLGIAWLGTQQAQQLIMALAAVGSVFAFASIVLVGPTRDAKPQRAKGLAAMLAASAVALLLLWVPGTPQGLIGYGRNVPIWRGYMPTFIYTAEGMNASIAVSEDSNAIRNFHVSGKVVASSDPQDMRLQRMLGHLPALLHPHPKTVLVVGCGAGVTAGSFIVHPTVERIVVCEIEPNIPAAAREYFGTENHHIFDDPRVEVVFDDARHFVATTPEKFDIISSDPIHPWVKGAATLYTREYFELCKSKLAPGGVVTQWVPLYESNFAAVQSEIATFFEAFPNGTIWSNDAAGQGYDIVLLGQVDEPRIDADDLQAKLNRDDHQRVVKSLQQVGLGSSVSLLTTYAGRAPDLKSWLEKAEINDDRSLRLQYLAGMGLNQYDEGWIYDSMAAFRRFPADIFPVNGANGDALKVAILNGESP